MCVVLLETKSFLQFQSPHTKAQTPTRICRANSGSTPLSHVPKNVLTELGGVILKAIWTVLHKTLTSGQSRKRCLIVSSRSQKLHLVGPVQLRFVKLSLVKITCLWRNHINTFIFKGILTAQTCLNLGMKLELITSIYIDLTVNTPDLLSSQRNSSGC